MPHLRFTRDRRGYENTFLVDTIRRRGREHSRVLYWFRSPPQVKVGRAAIDEDAIRALEDAYPEVAFDWSRILEARPPAPEPPPDERRVRVRGRDARRNERPPADTFVVPPEKPGLSVPEATADHSLGEIDTSADDVPSPEGPSAEAEEQRVEVDVEPERPEPEPVAHATEPSAAARVLGSEGLLRLRARYAEVGARIATQVTDPSRQEELRGLAERLNPDAWVTEAEVSAGLEQFEQILDQIRREVGPLRRRTRRGGRRNRRRRDGAALSAPSSSDSGAEAAEPSGGAFDSDDRASHDATVEPDDSEPGE